jgi:PhoPQ-activated pathogenicity-related protein
MYGGFTFALRDYWELNITRQADNPLLAQMFSIVDPYYYLQVCLVSLYVMCFSLIVFFCSCHDIFKIRTQF